jgi:peptidyl-prolyl cis-trans isomerase B (cyclophilin B)
VDAAERETNTDLKDVGTPPTKASRPRHPADDDHHEPGRPIVVTLDLASAPCSGASLTLSWRQEVLRQHRLPRDHRRGRVRCGTRGHRAGRPDVQRLQRERRCPTPSAGAGHGGAALPKGTVALIGNPPGTNGSQFLIFFKDFTRRTRSTRSSAR